MTHKKKAASVGQSIGGILVGFDQQIFRTTPPVNELVAKGDRLAPVAASGGGTMRVGMPGDPAVAGDEPAGDESAGHEPTTGDPVGDPAGDEPAATERPAADQGGEPASGSVGVPQGLAPDGDRPRQMRLTAGAAEVVVDLDAGGRIASLVIDGRELLRTARDGDFAWGSFPMAPYAGRVREAMLTFKGQTWHLPERLPPHAIHGTVLDRLWSWVDDTTIETELGPEWPFAGRVVQRFELGADHLSCRLELHADEPMPVSIGWHPWFVRRLPGLAGALELELDAGAMYVRDRAGITTTELVSPPPPGPWDDCFTDVRRSPLLRWPGFLELTVESDCQDWVVYTEPEDALCVEPQTAPPDAVNTDPTVVGPDRPLLAEMIWRWRSLAVE